MKKRILTQGFTLIELLVVIAIIGLLSTIVVASLSTVRKKARDTKRVADFKSLELGMELYLDAVKTYPATLSLLVPVYMPAVPVDPVNSGAQVYTYYRCTVSGRGYMMTTTLEDTANAAYASDSDVAALACTAASPAGTDPLYDIIH